MSRSSPWIAGLIVSFVATFDAAAQTYSAFVTVALLNPSGIILVLLNMLLTLILIQYLPGRLFRPATTTAGKLAFAVFIAAAFQTIIHSDLRWVEPVSGAVESVRAPDAPLPSQGHNPNPIAALYDRLEETFAQGMDAAVRRVKKREIALLVTALDDRDGLAKLHSLFVSDVEDSERLSESRKAGIQQTAESIVDDDDPRRTFRRKVEKLLFLMYRTFGRSYVRDLVSERGPIQIAPAPRQAPTSPASRGR